MTLIFFLVTKNKNSNLCFAFLLYCEILDYNFNFSLSNLTLIFFSHTCIRVGDFPLILLHVTSLVTTIYLHIVCSTFLLTLNCKELTGSLPCRMPSGPYSGGPFLRVFSLCLCAVIISRFSGLCFFSFLLWISPLTS